MSERTLLVTGGAGFIGSNFVLANLRSRRARIVTLDKLTYAGNLENLRELDGNPDHVFVRGDICDGELVGRLLRQHRPSAIVHFAAESHVDRSIDGPGAFLQTNVVGTFALLEAARAWVGEVDGATRDAFRFVHVSTDEVFGSLGATGKFTAESPYAPNSPYSASKASSDLFVRAYHHTYGLRTVTTNCSNNYGPYQFPEKLVPLMISNCLQGKPLPVYGTGANVRDWLHVDDHCEGVRLALERGVPGETYLFGGVSELTNLSVVHTICDLVDELTSKPAGTSRALITFVTDRPGHDLRYSIDASKAKRDLEWNPQLALDSGMRRTVQWYLDNSQWCDDIRSGRYRGERLGLGGSA